MEVHHHSHTPGKKFTHYLWEFLMLFLAVFCGFLAENWREHLAEHHREKEYMHALLEDLKSDTATIQNVYQLALIQKSLMDSMIELGNQASLKGDEVSRFYLLKGKVTRFLNIHLEDGTSSQLKNAGGMRLIRNEEVSALIRKYWDETEVLYRIRDRLEMAGENFNDVGSRIFSYKYLLLDKEPLDPPVGVLPGAVFINDDPKLIAELINRVGDKLVRTRIYINQLREAKEIADRLLKSIKEEYHFQ